MRQSDWFTNRGVTQSTRTDLTGDHLTGIEAHPQLQCDPVAAFDLGGQAACFLLNAQCRQTGTNSVVFQRNRRAEHGHDPVAGELVHRAAIALHDRRCDVDKFCHDLAEPLWTHRSSDVHGVHHIGEQDGYLLVLGPGIAVLDWGATAVTKPGVL